MNLNDVTNWRAEWKQVDPFYDEVIIAGTERGRSAAHIIGVSLLTNRRYVIFLNDFVIMATNNYIESEGIIKGMFKVVKRGRNLGIILDSPLSMTWSLWDPSTFNQLIPDYI